MPTYEPGITHYGPIFYVRWDAHGGYLEIDRQYAPTRCYKPTLASYTRVMLTAARQALHGHGRYRTDAGHGWTWHT